MTQTEADSAAAYEEFAAEAPRLLESSDPATLDGFTVDPTLAPTPGGTFEVIDGLADATIPVEYSGALEVGSGPTLIRLTPVRPGNEPIEGALVADDAVVYAQTDSGVNTAVRPTALGAEIFHLISSPDSSHSFAWHVEMPADSSLQTLSDGSIAVVGPGAPPFNVDVPTSEPDPEFNLDAMLDVNEQISEGQAAAKLAWDETNKMVLATIGHPTGRDAAGADLPIALSHTADTVTLSVETGSRVEYPLLIDPTVTSTESLDGRAICQDVFAGYAAGYQYFCKHGENLVDVPNDRLADSTPVDSTFRPQILGDADAVAGWDSAMSTIERMGSGSTSGYPSDLNDYELEFCFNNVNLCWAYYRDSRKSQELTEHIYTGSLSGSDNTRANAFQHAYWVALMVVSSPENRSRAFRYGRLHEGTEVESSYASVRRGSKADIVNNYEGFLWAQLSRAQNHNDEYFCSTIRDFKVSEGYLIPQDADPYYKHRQVSKMLWRKSHDTSGISPQLNGNDCSPA